MYKNNKIDVIGYDPLKDEYSLVMVEEISLIGDQLLEVQERFNTYLSFIFDGQMIDMYPNSRKSSIRIILQCPHLTDELARKFIHNLDLELQRIDILFTLKED